MTRLNGQKSLMPLEPEMQPAADRSQLSLVLEPPSLNYHLSEVRLFARLLTATSEEFGADIATALGEIGVQRVLGRDRIATSIAGDREGASTLRYIAHLYNAALGTDFSVVERAGGELLLYSDGALRRALEDLQVHEKIDTRAPARRWSERELHRFLESLPEKLPGLERFLLSAAPEDALINTPVSNVRTQPLYVQEVVIPTCNRGADLRRLLRSLERNFEFYGYRKDGISIRVFDTSTSASEQAATRSSVEAMRSRGLQVRYLGPREIRSELKRIRDQLPTASQKPFTTIFLRGIFSRSGAEGLPLTIGTIRNAIALIMGEKPYLSLDDDMMLDAPVPRADEYQMKRQRRRERHVGFDLHVGAATDFVQIEEIPSTTRRGSLVWIPTDIIGIANRHLDKPLFLAESRIVGAPGDSIFSKGEPRVSVVRPYLAGASPDVTIYLRRFIKSRSEGELSGRRAEYGLPLEVPASVLHRGFSSGTMFASSAGLSAPFLDARAYEDVAQSQLAETLFGNNVQFQGGVIEHRRHVGSRVVSSDQYIDILLGYHFMGRYTSNVLPDSFAMREMQRAANRVQALRLLGEKLWQDARQQPLSERALQSLLLGYREMGAAMRAARVGGAETFLTDDGQILARIRERCAIMQRLNGLLYFHWPEFVAATSRVSDL